MAHKLPLNDIKFIADFATYARSRGADSYRYTEIPTCALTSFMRDTGRSEGACGVHRFFGHGEWQPADCSDLLAALIGDGNGGSYSDLATRLEALIADAPKVSA